MSKCKEHDGSIEHSWRHHKFAKDKNGAFMYTGLGIQEESLKCYWCDRVESYDTIYPNGEGDFALEVAKIWRSRFSTSWKRKQN